MLLASYSSILVSTVLFFKIKSISYFFLIMVCIFLKGKS